MSEVYIVVFVCFAVFVAIVIHLKRTRDRAYEDFINLRHRPSDLMVDWDKINKIRGEARRKIKGERR